MTVLALAAFALPEAQAASRASADAKGKSFEGAEWNAKGSWWNSGQTERLDWSDGSSVAFYDIDHAKNHPCTISTTLVKGNYTTRDLRFYVNQTLIFDASNGNVSVKDSTEIATPGRFTVGEASKNYTTLTLKKAAADQTANSRILRFSNVAEWYGKVSVGEGITLQFGVEGGGAQPVPSSAVNPLTNDSVLELDGGSFVLCRDYTSTGKTVTAKHDVYVDADGTKSDTAVADYFGGGKDGRTIVIATMTANGGTVTNAGNYAITQDSVKYTLRGDGKAENLTEHVDTDYTVFYKGGEGDVAVSTLLTTSKNALTTVELGAGTLTVDALVSTVNATGGTLAFVGQGGVDTINVNDDITVSGDTNPVEGKAYKIAADKVVTFAEDLQLAGLSIVGEGGVTVKNVSESTVQYALGEQGALLSADEITMTAQAEANVTVGNQVAAGTVKNESESGYTLTLGKGNTAVNKVIASKGNIVFHNMGAEAISLVEMTIGEGKQVGVYQGTDTDPEATVSISNTLNAGGGTLLANLDLQAGSTLNLGGGQMTLGSTLTLQEGLIQLDDATLEAIAALQDIGDTHILINNATGTTLSYEGVSAGDWARTHFDLSRITDADYKIVANGTEFGLVKCSNVPEPTTGTLGLLALCALAARKRRKCN